MNHHKLIRTFLAGIALLGVSAGTIIPDAGAAPVGTGTKAGQTTSNACNGTARNSYGLPCHAVPCPVCNRKGWIGKMRVLYFRPLKAYARMLDYCSKCNVVGHVPSSPWGWRSAANPDPANLPLDSATKTGYLAPSTWTDVEKLGVNYGCHSCNNPNHLQARWTPDHIPPFKVVDKSRLNGIPTKASFKYRFAPHCKVCRLVQPGKVSAYSKTFDIYKTRWPLGDVTVRDDLQITSHNRGFYRTYGKHIATGWIDVTYTGPMPK